MIWPDFSFNGIKNRIYFSGQIGLPATNRLKKSWGHCQAKTAIKALKQQAIMEFSREGNGTCQKQVFLAKAIHKKAPSGRCNPAGGAKKHI